MPSPSDDRLVCLRGGLTVPLVVLRAMWAAEARGASFAVGDDKETVLVSPRGVLTEDERETLRRYRLHVRAILDYQVPDDARV